VPHPVAQDRGRLRADGHVRVELKTVWRDGTSHLLFEPIEFMEKLAAFILGPSSARCGIIGTVKDCCEIRTVLRSAVIAQVKAEAPEKVRKSLPGSVALERTMRQETPACAAGISCDRR
jgi:hypothetical protein